MTRPQQSGPRYWMPFTTASTASPPDFKQPARDYKLYEGATQSIPERLFANAARKRIMREKPGISEELLQACLQDQYAISTVTIEFLPLGLDMRAGVYRIVSEQGDAYLLKVKAGALYEPSCFVPRYLHDQGIPAVVAPLYTRQKTLWTRIEDWSVIVYPFIDGEVTWNPPMTDEQWQNVGKTFKQIHRVRPPAEGFESLRKETFDPTAYSRWVHTFDTQQACAEGGSQVEQELRSSWIAYQPTIHRGVTSLEKLAGILRQQSGPQVICHADLHPSNMIRGQANQVFVIDWDDVMLAPKERDFIFVGDARANLATQHDTAPFFQGYGRMEIDWTALTYYLWERVIQDVIAYAEEVFFRDDLGEATKIESLQGFRTNLSKGGKVDEAFAAAAHLPSDLR
jgi:spectinomycin phosphotransferase